MHNFLQSFILFKNELSLVIEDRSFRCWDDGGFLMIEEGCMEFLFERRNELGEGSLGDIILLGDLRKVATFIKVDIIF